MPDQEDYGLDFGPAPLDYNAALENIKKRAEQGKSGGNLTLEDLKFAAGQGPDPLKQGAAAPPAQNAPPLEAFTGRVKQQAAAAQDQINEAIINAQIKERLKGDTPSHYGDTPVGYLQTLVADRGNKYGDALGIIRDLYNDNDPYVRSLPNIDAFVSKIPSGLSSAARGLVFSAVEPVIRFEQWIADKAGRPYKTDIDTVKKLRDEVEPNPGLTALGSLVPVMAYGAATFEAAEPVAGAALAKLTLAPEALETLSAIKAGKPVLKAAALAAGGTGGLRAATLGASLYAQTVANNLFYGEPDPFKPSAFDVGIAGSSFAISRLFSRSAANSALKFVASVTGRGADELGKELDTVDKMLSAVRMAARGESPEVQKGAENLINRVMKEGAESYGAPFGRYVGRWFARNNISEDTFEAGLKAIKNEDFQNAARKGFQQANLATAKIQGFTKGIQQTFQNMQELGADEGYLHSIMGSTEEFSNGSAKWLGTYAAWAGKEPEDLYQLTKGLGSSRYYKVAADEYNASLERMGYSAESNIRRAETFFRKGPEPGLGAHNYQEHLVVDRPAVQAGGAQKYFAPLSQFHLTTSKYGPVDVTARQFKNPLEVALADGELPAYAAVARLKGNPKLSAAVLKVLESRVNKATTLPQSDMSNVIEALANRMAKKFGYDSIIYKGTTPEKNIYVDLREMAPLEGDAAKVLARFEKGLQNAGVKSVGKNFLSFALPIAGGLAAYDLYNPRKSEAMSVEPLAKAAAPLTKNFKTIISDLGEQVFGHGMHANLLKEIPSWAKYMAEDMPPELKNDVWKQLTVAIRKGFVRAGREAEGPFAEFNWDHEGARNAAYNFIKENHVPGDMAIIDMWRNDNRLMSRMGSVPDMLHMIKTGEPPIRVSRMRDFLVLPLVATGLGLMLPEDQAEAIDVKPLIKAASKFKSLSELVDTVEPQVGSMLKQAARLTGETRPEKVVEFLGKVQDDVHNVRGGAKILNYDAGPDYVGFHIQHDDLGPFPVANIRGVVDPDTGTWYPQVTASPLGISKQAVEAVGEEAKKIKTSEGKSLISKIANPSSLAGVIAATYLLKDFVMPNDRAEAMEVPVDPIVKLIGSGLRGAGDDVVEQIGKAAKVDDFLHITMARVKAAANEVKPMAAGESASGSAFRTFDTLTHMSPDAMAMAGSLDSGEGLNTAYRWRPPWSWSENPLWQSTLANFITKKDRWLVGKGSVNEIAKAKAKDIIAKVPKENEEEFYRAVRGMRTAKNGDSFQTAAGISDPVNDVAKQLHDEILNPLWQINTGVDPRVPALMQEFGLDESRANYRIIRAIQEKAADEDFPAGTTAAHQAVAEQTKGLLKWKPYQGPPDVSYANSRFIVSPIRQEREWITQEIKNMDILYGQNPPADKALQKGVLVKRLQDLDLEDKKLQNARKPSMDRIPSKQRFQPFKKILPDIPYETQLKEFGGPRGLLSQHIDGALSKAFFEEQLGIFKTVTKYLANNPAEPAHALADAATEFINTMRGIKSMREDLGIAQFANSLMRALPKGFGVSEKRFTVDDVRFAASKVMEFTWLSKLGFGLRFPIINVTQPTLTTAAVTGWGPLMRAYARVMNDSAIWDEALASNTLRIESGMRAEIEPGRIAQVLDYIPNKSENLNRVVTYAAAKDQALTDLAKGSFKVPHFVRTFNREIMGTGDAEKIAKEYAAAVVRTTQFLFGPEGRPAHVTGGAIRRIATQFKTFSAAYADFLYGTFKHARMTGDYGPLVRAATGLLLLGGPGTILPYEYVRRQMIKNGHDWLPPEQSGVGFLASTAASAFMQPDTSDQVKKALNLLQISGSFNPIPLSLGGDINAGFIQFFGGPTFGAAAQPVEMARRYAMGARGASGQPVTGSDVAASALGAVSPTLRSGADAALAWGGWPALNDWLSRRGYRGGVFSDAGKALIQRPSGTEILFRALNLQPSWRSQRYVYQRSIQAALEGGQMALAQKYLNEAQSMGFIFSRDDFKSLASAAKRSTKEFKPNEPLR